jgi:DNA-binding transcriptional MerR regulator
MPTEYTLSELAHLSGVSPRTVRYYIQSGLLPAPIGAGPGARYTEAHLDRLRVIRKLQGSHLPLAEIRRRLESIPDERIADVADTVAEEPPSDSALDYISTVLGRPREPMFAIPAPTMTHSSLPDAAPAPAPAASGPAPGPSPEPASAREPERAQWERISLDPDVEIHVRRPLSRVQNKRVERLISIARQLLEED